MKKIVSFVFITIIFFACKHSVEKDIENSAKTDSLLKVINSPELSEKNKQILENPGEAKLYNDRAVIYLQFKQFSEAINDAKRAARLDSTNALYYLTIVDVLFTENKTRDAKDFLERVEKKFPENTEALLKLAELYFLVKQYQKAIDYINKTLKIDENNAKAYYLKGSIYRESGDTSKALSSLETATEQDDKFEDAFYDIGIIYSARKNPIAIEYYNSVLKLNPKNQNALFARAKLLQDLGKIDEAITEYNSILIINKNCEDCLYNIGAIYLELKKDNKKALEYFTRAITVNSNYTQAYFARGFTYSKLKDKENARSDYNMCLKLEPNYAAAVQGLNEL